MHSFKGHNDTITSLDVSPVDQEYLLSSSLDGSVRIWNLSAASHLTMLEPSKNSLSMKTYPLTSVKFNPYERQFICSGHSRSIHLYDFESLKCIKESRKFPTCPTHLEFEAQGDFILCAGNNYMYCLNNMDLSTVANYSCGWKSLHKLMTIEVDQVPHVIGFELLDETIRMYSNNYMELFPFRMLVEEEKKPEPEEINYVVEKKPKSKRKK